MKTHFILIPSFLIVLNSFAQNTTVNIVANYDAAIGYHDGFNTADNNDGDAIHFGAYAIPGTNGGLNVNRALVKFDLSAIPAGATIISAKLNLYALGPSGTLQGHTGTNNSCKLQRITQSWGENTVTWNNQPTTSTQNEVLLPVSTGALQDYLNIDVLNLVNDMIAFNNEGFLLKQTNENPTNALLFCSSDCPDSLKYPMLEITYSSTVCIELTTGKDAPIGFHDNFNDGSINDGNGIQFGAYSIPGTTGGQNINRSLIEFDLSSIPVGANITSAKLNLYGLGPVGSLSGHTGTNNSAYLQRVTQSWTENAVTWNNQPSATTQNQVVLANSTSATQDYLNIDVLNLVSDMVANANNGFLIKEVNEVPTNVLIFCSSDHTNTAKHPKLEICYSLSNSITEEKLAGTGFELFPNPTIGSVTIKFDKFAEDGIIEVFSITGQLLKSVTANKSNMPIDLSNYGAGLYLVKATLNGKSNFERVIVLAD